MSLMLFLEEGPGTNLGSIVASKSLEISCDTPLFPLPLSPFQHDPPIHPRGEISKHVMSCDTVERAVTLVQQLSSGTLVSLRYLNVTRISKGLNSLALGSLIA